jgi:hypothetical protein
MQEVSVEQRRMNLEQYLKLYKNPEGQPSGGILAGELAVPRLHLFCADTCHDLWFGF